MNVKSKFKGKLLKNEYCNPISSNSETDPNLKFLIKFAEWGQRWEALGKDKKRLGMLSRETSFALFHTSSALVKLSNYLFHDHNFDYILLGKFQTDPLEARFGQYRQMSGGNYNVSVTQVLESEKKLKILNLLTINSKFGSFSIKDLKCNSLDDEDVHKSLDNIPFPFDSITDFSIMNGELSEHDLDVMIFISGYVSHSVCGRLKCSMCSNRLCTRELLEVDPSTTSQYFSVINRGGLKYSTSFSLSICSTVFNAFQKILKKFEEEFIKAFDQRNVLLKLCLNAVDDGETVPIVMFPLDTSTHYALEQCVIFY